MSKQIDFKKLQQQIEHDLREPILRMKSLLALLQSANEAEIKSEYLPVLSSSLDQMDDRIELILRSINF